MEVARSCGEADSGQLDRRPGAGYHRSVDYSKLFAALDARPFRPFTLEIVSGRRIEVTHPDNIKVLPNRPRVHHIEVYQSEPWDMAILWPEGLAAILYPDEKAAPEA